MTGVDLSLAFWNTFALKIIAHKYSRVIDAGRVPRSLSEGDNLIDTIGVAVIIVVLTVNQYIEKKKGN